MSENVEDLPEQSFTVAEKHHGKRLDIVIADLLPGFSRARLQQWIRAGRVLLNQKTCKPKDSVKQGELISVFPQQQPETPWQPEAIDLDIVYEDQAILVINKAAGMVSHPAAGNRDGTVCNALLHHCPDLQNVPRAGLVHRLDKDTSGVMVIAKTLQAHTDLVRQLQARSVSRNYFALVRGQVIAGATIDAPIGRHPVQRKMMAIVDNGKPAITHYRVEQRFLHFTLLNVALETGRTHQIRVHLAAQHLPIIGDPVYGGRLRLPPSCDDELRQQLHDFKRQALHAYALSLRHPVTGEIMTWQVPLAPDMDKLIQAIRKHDEQNPS